MEIPVKKLPETQFSRFLTYPILDEALAKDRVKELSATGVAALRFTGRTLIDGVPILGKGCVGIVAHAVLNGKEVALKMRRHDADRPSMRDEARLLRLANSVNVGPQLIAATRNFLVMELFGGIQLFRWIESSKAKNKVSIKNVLRQLLVSCFKLDAIGLDHGELSHAPKNVLVTQAGKACIVDFESASAVRRPANVTCLLQYFMFGRIAEQVGRKGIFPGRSVILKALVDYKREPSVENFHVILRLLRLV